MSGTFSAGGLITGLDSGALIAQLIQIDSQPIFRIEDRISALTTQRDAVRGLRTTLLSLRNTLQDFQFNNIFDAFTSSTSDPEVLTSEVSSSAPVVGAFEIDVQKLATATEAESSTFIGATINSAAALDSSGITTDIDAGTFTINGVAFTVDPTSDTLDSILSAINSSSAGVTASYDAVTDTVTFANTTVGDTGIINFGADGDDSNFLDVIAVTQATQLPDGNGSTAATSTRNLGAIDSTSILNTSSFVDGAITSGTFSINGISITVDPTSESLLNVLGAINESDAGVTASYDSSSDTIRVISDTLGSPTVRFGGVGDTSNFLDVVNLDTAVQAAGDDTQFTVNGGAIQTRNTNSISDAISGVTLNFLSVGTSTVTVTSDNDAIVEEVQTFIEEFNTAVNELRELTGSEGALRGDSGLRSIESYLVGNIFSQISGLGGDFQSLVDIGITSGEDFSAESGLNLSLDEDKFRNALRDGRSNVQDLFSNDGKTGVADVLFAFLDDATKATGYLNARAKANGTIDQQIQSAEDQIARIQDRLTQKEERLRRQFTSLEQISAIYQNQAAALSKIGIF
ncbi:MAG: flagellar filament capping protein FliD [Candidatus Hydrogenedentes bacterium]|nr:flagellar filament capping protein FliD [Candidatus Hydrogenedentota bacterium]